MWYTRQRMRDTHALCATNMAPPGYKNYIYATLLEESPHPFPPNATHNDGG
jgi:hypothetical protein